MQGLGKLILKVTQYVKDNCPLGYKDTIVVTFNPGYASRKSGDYVTVNIKYEVKYITPLMNSIIPSPYIINTSSTIRVE